LRGIFSKKWDIVQQYHEKKKSNDQGMSYRRHHWSVIISRKCLEFSVQCWRHRCELLHMNKSGTEIDVLRSNLLTFALRMQDNPWKLRKTDRHLLKRKLSFFQNARRSTLVAWKSRVDAALHLATACLLEVGSDIGQYQISNLRNTGEPLTTNNDFNEFEQPPKPRVNNSLINHTSKRDYSNIDPARTTNATSNNNFNELVQPPKPRVNNNLIRYKSKGDYCSIESDCIATSFHTDHSHVKSTNTKNSENGDFVKPKLDPPKCRRSKQEKRVRLARRNKLCVNEKIKIFENVRTTPTYGSTDKFGHKFPWIKSEKKWRQTIRTAQVVLEKNVESVTSDIEQQFF